MTVSLKLIAILFFLLTLWSCNNSQNGPSTQKEGKEISKSEAYNLDDLGISIAWTAYKFTDKIAVYATFEDYTITKENESGSIEHILTKLKISIPTECIDTGNAIRDFKLSTSFFEAFNTSLITGDISNAKDGEGIVTSK